MRALILGGAGSGKSAYAEQLALSLGAPRLYLATMEPFGGEAAARIQKHRAMRQDKNFVTVEQYRDLEALTLPPCEVILLECLTNLLANEQYGGNPARILDGIEALQRNASHLIVVSGDVFADGASYSTETLDYIRALGALNQAVAAAADIVVELVAGLPLVHRGRDQLEGLV